ncbi:MAG: adenylosuccinate synthetase [Acidithiobacillales bacterium]
MKLERSDLGQVRDEEQVRRARREAARPVYRSYPGWQAPTAGVDSFERLPAKARDYVLALEAIVGVKVALLSNGAKRDETILPPRTVLDEWLKPSLVD